MLFYFYPLLSLALISVNAPDWSTANYNEFFTSSTNSRVLVHTLSVSLSVTTACLVLGYPTAYVLSRARKYQSLLLLLVIVPYLTSFLVRTYAWIVLLGRKGIINSTLLSLGLIERPLDLIYNGFAVQVGMIHVMLPFAILSIYSVMRGIDGKLLLASKSLGAGPLRSHIRIFLPLSLPGIVSGGLLVFLLCLGSYITPVLLGGLRDVMLAAFIQVQVMQLVNWGFAAASAFVLLVVTLVGYFCLSSATGVTIGGKLRSASADGTSKRRLLALTGSSFRRGTEALKNSLRLRTIDHSIQVSRNIQKRVFPTDKVIHSLVRVWAAGVLIYLITPIFIVIPLSFSSASHLQFPPPGLSFRWYTAYFGNAAWLDPTMLSIQVGIAAMFLSTTLGTLAAYGLVRGQLRTTNFLNAVLISPIIVPAIVLGLALYTQYAAWGLIGHRLGLTIAHSIGALPYVVIIISATLAGLDNSLERASATLGAGRVRTFFKVTIPLIKPGIITAALFAFIHSFDELVITMFVAGARLQTLPLKIWENIQNEIDPTIAAVSCLLIALPAVLFAMSWLARRWRNKSAQLYMM